MLVLGFGQRLVVLKKAPLNPMLSSVTLIGIGAAFCQKLFVHQYNHVTCRFCY